LGDVAEQTTPHPPVVEEGSVGEVAPPVTRIGMMGGTFDPPHVAHLMLAEAALETLRLDRVVFVVAGDPWRKSGRAVSPAAARVAMVRAAVEPLGWATVSTVEVEREGPSYTAETLAELMRPGEEWWFILGADALADLPAWHEPRRIVELARLAVGRRPEANGDGSPLVTPELAEAVPGIAARIDVVEMPLMDVSATEIRRRVAAGESTEGLVPAAVRDEIDRLGLYR